MTQPNTMRALDPFRYLIGNRAAIERIAATRWAWVVGAILVLSAGIARNYDHLDLLRNPEWFIGPFVASLISAVFIYLWLIFLLRPEKGSDDAQAPQKMRSFGTFLVLVWMTAPCAWIYGIPVESYTDLLTATKWNIVFLAVVSVWRVFLVTRAVSVLSGAPWQRTLFMVLAPASLEMAFGTAKTKIDLQASLIASMGGIRLPPHEELLIKVSGLTCQLSFAVFFIMLIGIVVSKGRATRPLWRPTHERPIGALIMAGCALALWAVAAIPMHRGVSNRHQMEELIDNQQYDAALEFAASKQRSDFSGMHYLPPDPYQYGLEYQYMMLGRVKEDTPAWLVEEFRTNAVEACKLRDELDPLALEELKEEFPEIHERLMQYAAKLEEKRTRTSAEEKWLHSFKSDQ